MPLLEDEHIRLILRRGNTANFLVLVDRDGVTFSLITRDWLTEVFECNCENKFDGEDDGESSSPADDDKGDLRWSDLMAGLSLTEIFLLPLPCYIFGKQPGMLICH